MESLERGVVESEAVFSRKAEGVSPACSTEKGSKSSVLPGRLLVSFKIFMETFTCILATFYMSKVSFKKIFGIDPKSKQLLKRTTLNLNIKCMFCFGFASKPSPLFSLLLT
jgi:hypothetical protein